MKFISSLKVDKLFNLYLLKFVIVATMSSAAAYAVASFAPTWISPIVASVIALTAIKPTLHDTAKETTRQIFGTTIGAFLGLMLINLFGFNNLTLIILVAISLIVGLILKMDIQGSLTVSATVLLVAGPLLGSLDNVEERIAGVILGAGFAFLASIILTRRNPHQNILNELISISRTNSRLLKEISKTFNFEDLTEGVANEWLEAINLNIGKLGDLRKDIEAIYEDARFSPLIKKSEVKKVRNQSYMAKKTAENIRSIIFAVINSLEHDVQLKPKTASILASLLREISDAVKEQAVLAIENPSEQLPKETAKSIRVKRQRVAEEIKKMDDTRAIMLGGTLIHEATNIKDTLTES